MRKIKSKDANFAIPKRSHQSSTALKKKAKFYADPIRLHHKHRCKKRYSRQNKTGEDLQLAPELGRATSPIPNDLSRVLFSPKAKQQSATRPSGTGTDHVNGNSSTRTRRAKNGGLPLSMFLCASTPFHQPTKRLLHTRGTTKISGAQMELLSFHSTNQEP
jgi:hypothetical protein